jgi:hypothetical protein
MPDAPFSLKLYRFLLKFYPAGFQGDYAGTMEREFRDELAESTGVLALARLWIRLLADLAVSIPLQFVREISQDARHTLRLPKLANPTGVDASLFLLRLSQQRTPAPVGTNGGATWRYRCSAIPPVGQASM